MKRALTGIQPSGNVHIGNYLGMMRPALDLQKDFHCLYFIADLHALTSNREGAQLRQFTMDLVATWLALGLDVESHVLYRQSDVTLVTEYAWYLSCFTGLGLLEKAHAYKDARAEGREVNHGVLAYPVLMAADILMHDIDVVPVGKDQKQHVEIARDIAGAVNAALGGEVVKLPEPLIRQEAMTVPGLDGRKMSKSYKNEIALFCDEETLRKKVLSIKSDSTPLEAPKEIEGTFIGQLYSLFATPAMYTGLQERMRKGGMGWGHAKEELFQVINDALKAPRTEYAKLRRDEKSLLRTLDNGAERARAIAVVALNRMREALGFKSRSR